MHMSDAERAEQLTAVSAPAGYPRRQRVREVQDAALSLNVTRRFAPAPVPADDQIGRAMASLGLFQRRTQGPRLAIVGPPSLVRVAIADDDPLARLAIQAMINRADGLVFVGGAPGVDEIVEIASVGRAEAVVLDWMMPDGGGAEAARRIRTRNPDMGIVALTASRSREAARDMERAGAFGVLAKGGSVEELRRTIHEAIAFAA